MIVCSEGRQKVYIPAGKTVAYPGRTYPDG